jgi:tetratricopeptide (TPR) repeat protein
MKQLIFLFLLAFSRLLFAGEPTQELDYFTKGNHAYQSGDQAEAVKQYELALQNGLHAAELYENLGNAYFKQNQFGKSILNYEKGLLLSPNSKTIRDNLDFVKNKISLSTPEEHDFFMLKTWIQIRSCCTPNVWAAILLLLSFLTATTLLLLFSKRYTFQSAKLKQWLYVVLPALVFAFLMAKNSADYTNNSQKAIVIAKNATLYTNPDPKTEVVETLSEGSKLIILDQIGDWTKAQLLTGEEGWLDSKSLDRI